MSQRTRSPRRSDTGQVSNDSLLGRRRVLHAGSVAALTAVAGCLSDSDDDSNTGNGDSSAATEGDPDENDSDTDPEPDEGESEPDRDVGPLDVVDTYLEAAADGDADAIDEVMHSSSPLNPADWEEEGWEFRGGDGETIDSDEYETEILTEDGTVDDIFDLETAAFWFDEDELEAEIGDEEIALVELEEDVEAAETDGSEAGTSLWVLVTEADEWRVLIMGEEDDTPDDLEAAFEPEIIDEAADVVEEVDWDFEQADQGQGQGRDGEDENGNENEDEDGLFDDLEWAQVVLTDDPGLEADRVVIESTIEGSEFEIYGDDSNAWANSYANITFDPDGDQIVVTAVQNGDETVVHREHYEPESGNDGDSSH
ncbi:hypothetical protein [Natronoglomus mannanivorans]|uniref:Uncharacterized protein n=1 Tax=Natronoglomus mannanivorans TaxID=2979990 RepID=A0AAP2Z2S7_9EURY|nr:hypothetical protein [Halobacteria archaeon AArc-xg1-1]